MERSNQIGWAQVRAGIFILITILLLAGAILSMGQKTKLFTPTSPLTVTIDNVMGLKAGAPVWLAGVDGGGGGRMFVSGTRAKAMKCRLP